MMAAFSSYQYHPNFLPLDSTFFQNLNTTTATTTSVPIPQSILHHHQEEGFSDFNNNTISCVDQISSCCNKVSFISSSDNEPSNVSVTTRNNNLSPQSSMVVDKLEIGEQVTQKVTMERKRRTRHGSSPFTTNPQSKDGTTKKRMRKSNNNGGSGVEKNKEDEKAKEDNNNNNNNINNNNNKKKVSNEEEEAPKGYIHVRARRGQATDSHSLAERVRREKISERMKMLQRLVPGCDKVTGKALMLDEIINYVQSLQNQVEFLSLKLASVSPIFYDMATDLDTTLLVRPEKLNIQHCSSSNIQQATKTSTLPAPVTAATTAAIFPAANDHYLLDSHSASAFFQAQRSNVFSMENGSQFWDTEEQRQKFLHPYEFINNNNLCSFH